MPLFDHHVHTSRHSPDSAIDPLDLLKKARAVGLDGVVITDHDFQWPDEELKELSARFPDVRVFSGAEVSAREGHFLVYGLPDLDGAPPGVALKDLLALVRRHGAAIVAAHPFRWDQDFEGIVAEHGPAFDALELVSNNIFPETRAKTAKLVKAHNLACTGSSDGHEVGVVGCYRTEFSTEIRSISDFVAALKNRLGTPRHLDGARLSSGPVD